jgi:hypothetical protein
LDGERKKIEKVDEGANRLQISHHAIYMLCTTFVTVSSVTRPRRCGTWSPDMDPVCEWEIATERRYKEATRCVRVRKDIPQEEKGSTESTE